MESSRSDPRVVTPTDRMPPQWLRQCAESAAAQAYPCMHIVVADGTPAEGLEASQSLPVLLPGDFGDTPRTFEAFYAARRGCHALACLDADHWFDSDRITPMVARISTAAGRS
jgi:hypothetical protein